MKKSLLIGLSFGVASLLLSGCAKDSGQVHIQTPITETTKSVNHFTVKKLPQCPNYSDTKISSQTEQVEYIRSINIEEKEDGTQIANTETANIDYGKKATFSGCRNEDGSYLFKITNEVTDLKSIEKIVL